MNKYVKEAILIGIALLPYLYLSQIWSSLPDQVPTHFGIDGKPNDYSSKYMLAIFPALFGLGFYAICLFAPKIDPKKRIEQMGEKYYSLRLLLGGFFSFMVFYIIYAAYKGEMSNPGILLGGLGGLFAILGNYFQTVRPNYFIGIRTPWSLENEDNWKATHRLAGKLWMAGGLTIMGVCIFISKPEILIGLFLGITLFIAFVPMGYSYWFFNQQKKSNNG